MDDTDTRDVGNKAMTDGNINNYSKHESKRGYQHRNKNDKDEDKDKKDKSKDDTDNGTDHDSGSRRYTPLTLEQDAGECDEDGNGGGEKGDRVFGRRSRGRRRVGGNVYAVIANRRRIGGGIGGRHGIYSEMDAGDDNDKDQEDDDDDDDNNDYDNDDDKDEQDRTTATTASDFHRWSPSGSKLRDLLHFVGPGWFVSIAYVDPGNYQADIGAGVAARYSLLFALWWSSVLSMYVQVLCVRLAYYGQVTLAEAQARDAGLSAEEVDVDVDVDADTNADMDTDMDTEELERVQHTENRTWWQWCRRCCCHCYRRITKNTNITRNNNNNNNHHNARRYMNWFIAEVSAIATDLPEVIGMGIAFNLLFGWPYVVGVLLSLGTTMTFLSLLKYGLRFLECAIALFIGIMSISLWIEVAFVGVDAAELLKGWTVGITDLRAHDMFAITGILGSVVMPHNLYLHTASCMSRRVVRTEEVVRKAVWYSSLEPMLPIFVSFLVNVAVVAIAAETSFATTATADATNNNVNDDGGKGSTGDVGLTNFCTRFQTLRGGCVLWAIALLAAGQSSAITTTFTGQYVMDGFLNIRLPTHVRAILTRLAAIAPCVVATVSLPPWRLNQMVNVVNSALSFLLPFAFTPLVKYNCSVEYMGRYAAGKYERVLLKTFAIVVWSVNAVALSARGGGMFGDLRYYGNVNNDVDGGGNFSVDVNVGDANDDIATTNDENWSLSSSSLSSSSSSSSLSSSLPTTFGGASQMGLLVLEIALQLFYFWWNVDCLFLQSIKRPMTPLDEERPYDEQFAQVIT